VGDGQPAQVSIDAKTFGAKYQSKREVYRFLTHDCGAYLANYQSMTIFHMKEIVAGPRTRVKEADVKQLNVPHFEGLKMDTFLSYAANKPAVMQALPSVLREREALPRGYLANVIYTLVGEPFKQWVEQRVNNRHEQRRQEEGAIQMDSEIAAIFNRSTATSGKYSTRANNLLLARHSPLDCLLTIVLLWPHLLISLFSYYSQQRHFEQPDESRSITQENKE
jgi:hypothetical protein